jgi:ribosomal protein L7/L12
MTLIWLAGIMFALIVVQQIFLAWQIAGLRRAGLYPAAGQAKLADVEHLLRAGHYIYAVRCYREIQPIGLAEAKQAVDQISIRLGLAKSTESNKS